MADAVQKKPGFIARVKRFFRDIKGETKKIVWPTRSQIINNTIIVLVVMVIAAVVVGCLDIVASTLVRLFVNFI
ncbi:preprotein translocase subunit SecE [Youxingia wuxianensis]|uniref:Protein translocase subunit SecE n=1 Tax=Youxingia wuxianensis TaxID=2763678 RepID=A0A926IHC1_9FIRM|nr:preprotein translocase subunit SecE [Youxingia wuxianensis]MBC8585764.1 preprotein translocase subunit SecE [Youxingia wuxianensis]